MEFRNIEEAKTYIEGRVPGATSEQIQAAKDYLDSTEAKAEQAAKASPVLSKTQSEENESMNRLQAMAANNPAVQAAQKAGEKAQDTGDYGKNAPKKGEFQSLKDLEDKVNNAIENKDNYYKGDEFAESQVVQSIPAVQQNEKNMKAATEAVKATKPEADFQVGDEASNVETAVTEAVSENPTKENVEQAKEVVETVQEAQDIAQPEKNDTKPEKAAKNDYKKSTRSIWDAYYNGDIDKTTATYFTLDAIATLSKNLGREIGNIGAQFTGGAIDSNVDTSKWEQRQNELYNEEVQMEKEGLGGPAARRAEAERLANEGAALGNVSQEIQNEVASIRANYTDEQIRQQIAMMDKQLEQMGLNIENMEDARTFVETLKQKPESERSWLDNLMIAWMSQSGVNAAVNAGSSGIGSLIGLLAK